MTWPHPLLFPLLATLLLAGCAANPRLLERVPETGYSIHRSGQLEREELAQLCREEGLDEIVVLNGSAAERECAWRDEVCPGLRVRYDARQDPSEPLTADFLEAFDHWVEAARTEGRAIAVRCRHGWHRAGRLSAYYRIEHQNLTLADALGLMHAHGRFMWMHPYLDPQVEALWQLAHGLPCEEEEHHCVRRAEDPFLVDGRFPADVCPAETEQAGRLRF